MPGVQIGRIATAQKKEAECTEIFTFETGRATSSRTGGAEHTTILDRESGGARLDSLPISRTKVEGRSGPQRRHQPPYGAQANDLDRGGRRDIEYAEPPDEGVVGVFLRS